MGRLSKKRPTSAPLNWQTILTEMAIGDDWPMKLEDNTADNARAAIKGYEETKGFLICDSRLTKIENRSYLQ